MQKKKKIFLIVSAGQSGSTLLDLVLGAANKGFSLGEISSFNKDLNFNLDNPVYCGCKSRIDQCDFFTSFNNYYSKQNNNQSIFDPSTKFDLFFDARLYGIKQQLSYHFSLKSKHDILVDRNVKMLDDLTSLYTYIFDHFAVDHIVDSSKGLYRALSIYKRLKKKYEVHFIHLIRDQRAVAYSFCNKKSAKIEFDVENQEGGNRVEFEAVRFKKYIPIDIMKTWMKVNLKSLFILNILYKKKYHQIKHEDYTQNPEKEITKLCAKLDIDYRLNPKQFELANNHIISGSKAKFSAVSINSANEKWRQDLDNETFKSYGSLQKMVNRLFGYK